MLLFPGTLTNDVITLSHGRQNEVPAAGSLRLKMNSACIYMMIRGLKP